MDAGRTRPSFEKLMMGFAVDIAERSTCLRLRVGCVITNAEFTRVLSIGYNGNSHGLPNTCDLTGPDAVGTCGDVHAEANAIVKCDFDNEPKILFSTHLPCVACGKLIVQLRSVRKVYYANDYRIRDSLTLFDRVGIEHEHLELTK